MKAAFAPVYLTLAGVITVGYGLFTNTAIKTIALYMQGVSPAIASMLNTHVEILVFIFAFTWIFVLSNVIPDALFGGDRSNLFKYFVCLICTAITLPVQALLTTYGGVQIQQLFSAATFLENPILAVVYLAIPYVVMISIDMHARKKKNAPEPPIVKKAENKENASPVQNPNTTGTPIKPLN